MEVVLRKSTLLRHYLHVTLQAHSPSIPACQEASHAILTHQLLAGEQQTQQQPSSHQHASAAQQHVQAVEAWCSAVTQQLRKPQAAPAAAALLGTTAQACDAERLLQNYVAWGTSLADALKKCCNAITQASSTNAVPCASTAAQTAAVAGALCQLFSRLHDFLDVVGVRRDASSLATRAAGIITPMLAALVPAAAGTTCASLLRLCATLLRTLPTAFRHHAPPLERALVSIVATPTSSSSSISRGGSMLSSSSSSSALAELRACAVRCLGLLPRAPGEAASHSTMFRRLLLSLHEAMDGAFMGLDSTNTATNTTAATTAHVRELLRTGAPAPPANSNAPSNTSGSNIGDPLIPQAQLQQGASSSGGSAGAASGEGVRMQLEVVRALLVGLEALLVEPFPSPVPLPSAALLATLTRLLTFNDGAVLATGRVPPSSSGFARLAAGLPALQATGWSLLGLLLRVGGSSLLPLLPSITRLLADPLRRIAVLGPSGLASLSPHVRCAVYGAAHTACEARGACATRLLADAAIAAVTVELYGWSVQQQQGVQGAKFGAQAWGGGGKSSKQAAKRAKLAGAAEAVEGAEAAAAAAAAAAGATTCLAAGTPDLEAQLAALQLLESLARTGAPLLPPLTRAQLDAVTYHVASSATAAAHRLSHGHPRTTASGTATTPATSTPTPNPSAQSGLGGAKGGAGAGGAASAAPGPVVAGVAALRAAALRALLASVLAPAAGQRPPFLTQALQLFRDAAASGRPEVSSTAKGAELHLEALLHPRALPITCAHPSASTYAGLQELAPLPRPRMWSVLDPLPMLMHPQSQPTTAQPSTAQQPGLASAAGASAGFASQSKPSGLGLRDGVQSSVGREQQTMDTSRQPGAAAPAAGAAMPAAVKKAREALDAERQAAATHAPDQADGVLPDQGARMERDQDGQGQRGAAKKAKDGQSAKGETGGSKEQVGEGNADRGGAAGVKRRADGSELPAARPGAPAAGGVQGATRNGGDEAAASDGDVAVDGPGGAANVQQQEQQQQQQMDDEPDDEDEDQEGQEQSAGQHQSAGGGMPAKPSPVAAVGAGQGESSDSEGPLPEIDSGDSVSDEESDDEEMGS